MFLDLPRLPFPAKNAKIFGRDAPLALEIGMGDGRFLGAIAKSHPDWNYLGVDVARGSVARAFRHLRRLKLSNVRLHHGSGLFLLRNILENNSLSDVYVNFPDPWSKHRHADRRLFNQSFFRLLAARLRTEGTLLFTTDDEQYFDQTISLARESGYFQITNSHPPPAVLRTKYARKWRSEGRSVFHVQIQKQVQSSPEVPPNVHKEAGMHHALLNGTIPPITEFEKVIHHFPNGHVVVLDVLQMIGRNGLVFVTRVHEPELVQELFLQLRPTEKSDTELLLSIMNFGKPIATQGTSEAINAVVNWLTHQDVHVISTYN